MKKVLVLFIILFSLHGMAQEKNALLIIAHGSPSQAWCEPVMEVENQVKALLKEKAFNACETVRVALMEFGSPSVATVIKELENQGITHVYALPLFIAPSGHSVYDVPALLGVYYTKKMDDMLKEEKAEIVNTPMKITVGPSLNYENIIKEILLDQVKTMSEHPESEALVLLAHGSEGFEPIWDDLLQETGNYILGKTGIQSFDYAFVEVGQSFAVNGMPAVLAASERKEKVIVAGMYVSMGVRKMAENSGLVIMGHTLETKKMLEGKNIVFADKGLLPDNRITEWIVDRAMEWANR